MGRPPLGKTAMTDAERMRRYRLKRAKDKPVTKPVTKPAGSGTAALAQELAAAKARIAELEAKRREGLVRSKGAQQGTHAFGAVGTLQNDNAKLRGQNAKLRDDNAKLKAALAEEPDAAKLRRKVIDQQVEIGNLRSDRKQLVKERDAALKRAASAPRMRAASKLLTRENYSVLIKALHDDRLQNVSTAELREATRVAIQLRPLFTDGG